MIFSAGIVLLFAWLTAYAMRSDQEKALRAGFDSYLTKPIDRAELLQMIQEFLTEGRPLAKNRMAGVSYLRG